MAFPTVVAVNGGNATVDATSVTINLPDGSDVANRLILLFFTSDGSGETFTWPTGFTEILAEGGSGFTSGVAYKFTTGSEGYAATGATVTLTISSVEQSAHTTYLLSGVDTTTAPVAATATTGTSTAPNSGSLNPATWGTEDTLWFTFCSLNGTSNTAPRITVYPTNYTNGRSDISIGGNGVVQAVARRELNAASEDPGAFTSDTSVAWRASTIGVRPGAVAYTLAVTSQSYTQTNNAVNLLYGRKLSATSQSYTVTANAVGLLWKRAISVASQTYAVTANAVSLLLARVLAVTSQTYTVTANDVTLTKSGISPTLAVDTQNYTVTAGDVGLTRAYSLPITTASTSITANNVGLLRGYILPIASRAYTVTANAVGLVRSYILVITQAVYSVTFNDVSLIASIQYSATRYVTARSRSLSTEAGTRSLLSTAKTRGTTTADTRNNSVTARDRSVTIEAK